MSPFELVFGRKPRLSARDITFPTRTKSVTVPPSDLELAKRDQLLRERLQGYRFAHLDAKVTGRQRERDRLDRTRNITSTPLEKGVLVHLHQPTRTLKKLRYQWSAPTFLVLEVFEGNTCRLLPLVSAKGRALTRPSPVVANLKMVKASRKGKPSSGFWIGCRVLSSFGNVQYVGTVDDVEVDGTQTADQARSAPTSTLKCFSYL